MTTSPGVFFVSVLGCPDQVLVVGVPAEPGLDVGAERDDVTPARPHGVQAPWTSVDAIPCPSNAGSTSVCVNTTVVPIVSYTANPSSSPSGARASNRCSSGASLTCTSVMP